MKDIFWALVMSSTEARILQDIAPGRLDDAPELVLTAEHKDLRDIMSDKPGRSFASEGSGRSAMEYSSDPVKDAKRAFVDQVASLLHGHFVKHDFSHLAIFAGPEMLGLLREGLPPDLAHAVVIDLPKNLQHEPPQDLRRIVTQHVFSKG